VVPVLECERVRLRPFRADDRDAVFAVFGDPVVARYWSFAPWTEHAQAEAFLAPLLAGELETMIPWAIAERATDTLVGTTTVFAIHRDQGRAEIGYSLQRARWGNGLARSRTASTSCGCAASRPTSIRATRHRSR
jgi:[ribosomal protein S5]-alanine N-acetyltransferase